MENSKKSSYTKSSHCKLEEAARRVSSTPVVYEQQAWKILDQVQDDKMIKTVRAFTLMELLVVVLIIGVLAAVAVPQYKKAVLKSRFKTLYPVARSLAQAQESYYLGTGDYAENLSELDVSVPGDPTGQTTTLSDGTQVKLGAEENHVYVRAEKGDNALMIYQNHSPNFAGETHCEAKLDNTLANWLCEKGLDGTFVGNKFGYSIYSLSEKTTGDLARSYYNGKGHTGEYDGDTCVATQMGGCVRSAFTNGATCKPEGTHASCYYSTFDNGSTCEGNARWNCSGGNVSSFSNGSTCNATYPETCDSTTFSKSTCIGNTNDFAYAGSSGSCYNSTFTSKSACKGEGKTGCHNSTFEDHSYCQANKSGSCANNTYDTTSFCTSADDYCPTGTPKGTWDAATDGYKLDGWNGGCCNPAYMTSGECPSGATVCSE